MHYRNFHMLILILLFVNGCGSWSEDENTKPTQPIIQADNKDNVTPFPVTPLGLPPTDATPKEISTDPTGSEDDSLDSFPSGETLSQAQDGTDFRVWLAHPKNHSKIEKIGQLSHDGEVLILETDATLSFSDFASSAPLTIKTNGYNLTLIGKTFNFLKIESKSLIRDSGSVRIFAYGSSLPMIDTSGSDGKPGTDGECTNESLCVPVSDRLTRIPVGIPQVSWMQRQEEKSWDWNDQSIPAEWRQQILSNILPDAPASAQSYCAPQTAHGIHVEGPFLVGHVKLRQNLELPADAEFDGSGRSVSAKFFPGQTGLNGFNAGNISIFTLFQFDSQTLAGMTYQSGAGGTGGRHRKSPPSQAVQEIQFETRKLSEQLELEQLNIDWRLQFFCSSEERAISRLHTISSKGIWMNKILPVSTDLILAQHRIKIQRISEGNDLHEDTALYANPGKPGRSGKITIRRLKSIEEMKLKADVQLFN
jgi:hypothetical protein